MSSGLLLHPVPIKALNPSTHDTGVWSNALRITSHLAANSPSSFPDESDGSGGSKGEDFAPIMMLESYRLARNLGNLKHAHALIQQQIVELTGDDDNPVETLRTSSSIPAAKKLRIMRELAKMYSARGQASHGVGLLTESVVSYSQSHRGGIASGRLGSGSELAARSLLVIVKWMQADSRVMQAIWSPEFAGSQGVSILLKSELEYRKAHGGLYETASANESYQLFQPDESVARFEKHEYFMGQLLHLTTMYCPDLAKGWWSLAGWCYRIGRKNLEALRYVTYEEGERGWGLGVSVMTREEMGGGGVFNYKSTR